MELSSFQSFYNMGPFKLKVLALSSLCSCSLLGDVGGGLRARQIQKPTSRKLWEERRLLTLTSVVKSSSL